MHFNAFHISCLYGVVMVGSNLHAPPAWTFGIWMKNGANAPKVRVLTLPKAMEMTKRVKR